MKAVIADKLAPEAVEALRELCTEVVFEPTLNGDALTEACADANIVVVRSTQVREAMMERCPGLKLVIRAGSGYNTIDFKEGAARGVAVANCPGKNAVAVAELAMGLIVSLDRFIPDNVALFREGTWNKAGFAKAKGLKGRTLGLVGVGNIGSAVAERAKAFGMPVIAFDPYVAPDKLRDIGIEPCASLDELLPRADVISLHAAQTAETKGLIGREQFAAMKPGASLINTSRGPSRRARLDRGGERARHQGRRRRLRGRAGAEDGRGELPAHGRGRHLRDPPHRRLHRAGPVRGRRRSRQDRQGLPRHREGLELREPLGFGPAAHHPITRVLICQGASPSLCCQATTKCVLVRRARLGLDCEPAVVVLTGNSSSRLTQLPSSSSTRRWP